MKKLEKTFKAFANTSRLRIVQFLKKNKGSSVEKIAEATRCSYKATSKHLGILFQADILDREQVSYEMRYRINDTKDPSVATILNLL